ncbi:MAG TPA: ABC-three component system protein [Polaromonas sp.]|uniref:ABC-three component system protein n=1 Tax=Polaromonas sp. TaxID=1869339 RepID=UPI002D56DC9C|nr:ABC-three component system protein [Polaromonas sp.]HYW56538.1 ABC-three component system protein [Polaromonas sp.]
MDEPGRELMIVPKSSAPAGSGEHGRLFAEKIAFDLTPVENLQTPSLSTQHIETVQKWNQVAGDFAGGNIDKSTSYFGGVTAMTRLIRQYSEEQSQNQQVKTIIGALEHYMSQVADEDIRSLEVKLTAANRTEQIATARKRKHEAVQFLMRHESSPAAHKIISFLLAKLQVSYENQVMPLINSGADRIAIDGAIQASVLDPAWSFLESNPLDIDHRLLTGFLYFLGGNCHIRWDPC